MSVFDGTVSPTRVGPLVIGAYDHINGSGAEPSGFVVTKHELEEVARYWFHERLENAFRCFEFQQGGSREWRTSCYSADRLDAIADVLGIERLEAIYDEVSEEFEKTINPETWRLFTVGTEGERNAFYDREDRQMNEFETNPFEVRIRAPQGEYVRRVVFFLCSGPLGTTMRGGNPYDAVRCRYATRAEAEDLAQRLSVLRIPGLDVQVVTRETGPDGTFSDANDTGGDS